MSVDYRGILLDILTELGYKSGSIDAVVSGAYYQEKKQLDSQEGSQRTARVSVPIGKEGDILTFLLERVDNAVRTLEVVLAGPNKERLYRRMPPYVQRIITT